MLVVWKRGERMRGGRWFLFCESVGVVVGAVFCWLVLSGCSLVSRVGKQAVDREFLSSSLTFWELKNLGL